MKGFIYLFLKDAMKSKPYAFFFPFHALFKLLFIYLFVEFLFDFIKGIAANSKLSCHVIPFNV